MPTKADSRFAQLPVRQVLKPDGTTSQAIGLRLKRPRVDGELIRHRVTQGETVDLLARRFYRDERLWWRILDANPLVYPLDVEPGDVLSVPAPGPATRATRARSF